MRDTLDAFSGKWKPLILVALRHRPFRFRELSCEPGITPRLLTKELRASKQHQLISRTGSDTRPIRVEYASTPRSLTLVPGIPALRD